MWYYCIKILITAVTIVAITEIAKRNSAFAAVIAFLPLISLFAFAWMKIEGVDVLQIAELSQQIFWLVIPSLLLFFLFPLFIRFGLQFWLSLGLSVAATVLCYLGVIVLIRRFGVTL